MASQKIFFGINIKFLRERKKLSQEMLAAKLEIGRAKLAAIEGERTKAHQPEDYLNFSQFFKISIDALLRIDLSKLGEQKLRELETGSDVYMSGGKIRVLAISVDKNNNENTEYVPIKSKAGYTSGGYNDPEYIGELPKYSIPNLPKHGTFRTFPIEGDSMLPIPSDSDVTCQFVQDWKSIKAGTKAILILNGKQDFVFKQITIQPNGTILCISTNPIFEPYTIAIEDVLEIWEYYAFTSRKIPEVGTEEVNKQMMAMVTALYKKLA